MAEPQASGSRARAPTPDSEQFHFGVFELDRRAGELRKRGVKINLHGQPLEILAMLLERPGEVVSREDLRKRLWTSETTVDFDNGLNKAINKLRQAFGDLADIPRYIETLPRHGYRFVAPVEELSPQTGNATPAPNESRGKFRAKWIWITVSCCILAGALAFIADTFWYGSRSKGAATTIEPSVAVLPFADLSPKGDEGYFSDGLAEELLDNLAKIQGLRVTARTSSFQFKGKNEDSRVIGQKLNVATLLEGSVRKEGHRVRISAQLINTADGFHIWSDTYDRELNDIFQVQESIARSVAESLKVELLAREFPPPRRTNELAYIAYLHGQDSLRQSDKDSFDKATEYDEKAILLDSNFAPAWAGLARALIQKADCCYVAPQEVYDEARADAERALALDKNLADAYAELGWIQTNYDFAWAAADASYQRALALEPGNVSAIQGAAILASAQGRIEQSLGLFHRLVEINPLDAYSFLQYGVTAQNTGHLDEATAALQKALEINPNLGGAHVQLSLVHAAQSHPQMALADVEMEPDPPFRLFGLALAYQALGRKKEADGSLNELISKYGSIAAFQIAQVYASRGEADSAFEWLERAYAQHDSGIARFVTNPRFNPVKRDPRYTAFLKKLGLS
jgi:TolB-like protein/DNA-binding winged helix-turn-helix (wHTH) protein/lipoprotein NlpI